MSSPLPTTPTRVFDLLAYQQAHFPKTDSLASKVNGTWVKFSTAEVLSIVERLACGLQLAGIRAGDKIANVTDNNRPEWNFIDLATLTLGAVHVPIYPNASAEDYRFILSDARPSLVFVSNQRLLELIRPLVAEVPGIRNIYTYDDVTGAESWKMPTLYDPMAVTYAIRPELCPTQPTHLEVDEKGFTRPGPGEPNAQVCLRSNENGFAEFLLGRLLNDATH